MLGHSVPEAVAATMRGSRPPDGTLRSEERLSSNGEPPTKRRDIEPRLAGGWAFKFRQTIRAVEAAGLARSRAAN